MMMKRGKKVFTLLTIIFLLFSPLSVYADYGDIVIDGYYDDWEDKPYTEVYQGNNPKDKVINLVSLFRDENNIYVHIIFSEQYSQGIKNMRVELETNLGDGYFELDEPKDIGENNTVSFNIYQDGGKVSDGFITVEDWKTIEAEFYIPLDTITSQADGVTEIGIQIKKLGQQWIHSVGASTNPLLGIGLSVFVVAIGVSYYKYKKKNRAKQ